MHVYSARAILEVLFILVFLKSGPQNTTKPLLECHSFLLPSGWKLEIHTHTHRQRETENGERQTETENREKQKTERETEIANKTDGQRGKQRDRQWVDNRTIERED